MLAHGCEVRDAKNNEVHDVQNNARKCVNGRETVSAQCLETFVRAGEVHVVTNK